MFVFIIYLADDGRSDPSGDGVKNSEALDPPSDSPDAPSDASPETKRLLNMLMHPGGSGVGGFSQSWQPGTRPLAEVCLVVNSLHAAGFMFTVPVERRR